ncbi:PIN domain-containing protein [Candidatus Microgenomates bacterium]|nr:PIN domain-containing protein [Candidatus Microgenomates bacterium]
MYLLDSNILIYAHNLASPFHKTVRSLVGEVLAGRIEGCVSFQNLYELYSIITDSKRVEKPLSVKDARKILLLYLKADNFPKIYSKNTNLAVTLELLKSADIKKQQIFDLILVATMIENEVKGIYTADETFFKKFKFLEVINPFKDS